jgi:hypothetical protein
LTALARASDDGCFCIASSADDTGSVTASASTTRQASVPARYSPRSEYRRRTKSIVPEISIADGQRRFCTETELQRHRQGSDTR